MATKKRLGVWPGDRRARGRTIDLVGPQRTGSVILYDWPSEVEVLVRHSARMGPIIGEGDPESVATAYLITSDRFHATYRLPFRVGNRVASGGWLPGNGAMRLIEVVLFPAPGFPLP